MLRRRRKATRKVGALLLYSLPSLPSLLRRSSKPLCVCRRDSVVISDDCCGWDFDRKHNKGGRKVAKGRSFSFPTSGCGSPSLFPRFRCADHLSAPSSPAHSIPRRAEDCSVRNEGELLSSNDDHLNEEEGSRALVSPLCFR